MPNDRPTAEELTALRKQAELSCVFPCSDYLEQRERFGQMFTPYILCRLFRYIEDLENGQARSQDTLNLSSAAAPQTVRGSHKERRGTGE